MESYKLVNSDDMENKAEKLGLMVSGVKGGDILFIRSLSMDYYTRDIEFYACEDKGYQEITQKDFLALPEPLKVGDWIKCELKNWIRIVKIERLNDDYAFVDTHGIAYELDICTKLTQEEKDILNLD